jgi:hypothetical protein
MWSNGAESDPCGNSRTKSISFLTGLLSNQVLEVPVVLLADVLDQFAFLRAGMGCEGPRLRISARIVDGVDDLHVARIRALELLRHDHVLGVRETGLVEPGLVGLAYRRMSTTPYPWTLGNRPQAIRLAWKILHDGVSYIEQAAETTPQAKKRRAQRLTQALRKLGDQVAITPIAPKAEVAQG